VGAPGPSSTGSAFPCLGSPDSGEAGDGGGGSRRGRKEAVGVGGFRCDREEAGGGGSAKEEAGGGGFGGGREEEAGGTRLGVESQATNYDVHSPTWGDGKPTHPPSAMRAIDLGHGPS